MNVKQQVSDFYNQVGWQQVSGGCYQNARYEDLRPVSQEYIHRCHLRLARHLAPRGRFLLDAGSGPVQYPEYLEYSRGYQRRVCVDISIVALQEARKRLGEHGLYVVADIANLPFKSGSFDGEVSLHTIHHLPKGDQANAYRELYRALAPGAAGAVVNGWERPVLSVLAGVPVGMVERVMGWKRRLTADKNRGDGDAQEQRLGNRGCLVAVGQDAISSYKPTGTFVGKHNARWLKQGLGREMPLEIWVWRSVEVRFLRTFIHERLGGRYWLRLLFWLEDKFPHFFGENGQYPLIIIRKQQAKA